MFVYDEHGDIVHDPDLTLGWIENKEVAVSHRWIVDAEEQSHVEVIRTYPNGGVETCLVIDEAEKGRWETVDGNGNIVDFNGFIPDDAPKDASLKGTIIKKVYRKYTAEELQKIQEAEEAKRIKAEKKADSERFVAEAPERLATIEVSGAESRVVIMELTNAVAELGVIVTSK